VWTERTREPSSHHSAGIRRIPAIGTADTHGRSTPRHQPFSHGLDLYRTAAPLPELKPESYELNLTRVTFPPGMPSNPPHHRSGAALYYIVSGIGANTVDGKTADRGPGSLIYEPFGLVHQWGNPGSEPLTFLAFNINLEGVPAVVPETPTKP
jgi:mannose-6-phosphate isomerase-like protein (cupin superfamily)